MLSDMQCRRPRGRRAAGAAACGVLGSDRRTAVTAPSRSASLLSRDQWVERFVETLLPFLGPNDAAAVRVACDPIWVRFGDVDPAEIALDILESCPPSLGDAASSESLASARSG